MIAATQLTNPFPGLRAYEPHQADLFFGRDEQIEELLERLQERRFLAVVGTSGSGKSSLVRAGLIPTLQRGYFAEVGSRSRVVILRPGGMPVVELARSLARAFGAPREEDVLATLGRSSLGLVDFADRKLASGESLLLVIDQFEEVFRYSKGLTDSSHAEESVSFVKLLLTATGYSELPLPGRDAPLVYVILTMRSDFLGKCARFRGLPEALNDSQYLVPRMNREQQQQAIEGPIVMSGARISPRLVQRLLNDVGDDPDQLPVLQHALMRTWEQARDARATGAPIDISDYDSSGEMKDALNKDAEQVFDTIQDEQDRRVVRRIFQRLVEPSAKDEETRRPTPMSELVAVTDAPEEKVRELIDIFRHKGFLTLSEDLDPIVDITHESLIRLWGRLNTWVSEEVESAKIYSRLAESARTHTSLYRDPELTEALRWKERESPNAAWAERYPPWEISAFPVAAGFLEESKKERERQQAIKRRNRLFLIAGLVGALVLAVFASVSWARAEKLRADANEQRRVALEQQRTAIALKLGAEADALGKGPARLSQRSLLLAAEALRRYASRENDYALRQVLSRSPLLVAHMKHDRAVLGLQFSSDGKLLLSGSADKTARIWEVASGRELGRITHQDEVRSVRLSRDGHYFITTSGAAEKEDEDDDEGKADEQKKSKGKSLTGKESPEVLRATELDGAVIGRTLFEQSFPKPIRGLAFDPTGRRVVVNIGDRLLVKQLDEPYTTQEVTFDSPRNVLSDRGDYFAVSTKGGLIQVIDCRSLRVVRSIRPRDVPSVNKMSVYPACLDGQTLGIVAGFIGQEGWDYELGFWNLTTGRRKSPPFKYSVEETALSPSGDLAALINTGTVILWDTVNGKELWNADTEWPEEGRSWRHLKFTTDNTRLAVYAGDRVVRIYNVSDHDELFRVGLDKQASEIALSPDGQYLAVGEVDGNLTVWRLERGSEQQLISDAPNYVSLPRFSHTGRFRLTFTNERLDVADQNEGRKVLEVPLSTDRRTVNAFSSDDRFFAGSDADGKVRVYDLPDGRQLTTLSPSSGVVALSFSAPANTLVISTRDGIISKWNPVSGESLGSFETGRIGKDAIFGNYEAYFSGNAALCAITVSDDEYHLWDVEKGMDLGKIEAKTFWQLKFSPDGKLIAVNDSTGMAVWRTEPLGLAWHDKADYHTWSFIFSPDGKSLAAPLGRSEIVVWDAASGQSKFTLKRDVEAEEIEFTPDSQNLAATYHDGFAFIWRLRDKSAIAQIPLNGPQELGSRGVSFTPDGKLLIIEDDPKSGQGNVIRMVWWHPDDLINEACRRLSRNLTSAEWEQYLLSEPYNKTCPNLP